MYFLGYHFGIERYKHLDLDSNYVFVSRDAVFHVGIFFFFLPFQTPTSTIDASVDSSVIPCPVSDIASEVSLADPHLDFVAQPTSTNHTNSSAFELIPRSSPYPDSLTSNSPSLPTSLVPLGRFTRPHQPPDYVKDYTCDHVASSTPPCLGQPFDIAYYHSYSKLCLKYKPFALVPSTSTLERESFYQAL